MGKRQQSFVMYLAAQIADRLWPIGGDPTFPESREGSDGWLAARDGAASGIRIGFSDIEKGEWSPDWLDESRGDGSVYYTAREAGYFEIQKYQACIAKAEGGGK